MSAAIFHLRARRPLTHAQRAALLIEQAAELLDSDAEANNDAEPRYMAEALRALARRQPGATLCVVRAWSLLRSGGSCGT